MSTIEPKENIYNPKKVSEYLESRGVVSDLKGQFNFTSAEIRVCGHLVQGKSTEEIAQALFVGVNTVKNQLKNMVRKVNIRNGKHSRILLMRCVTAPKNADDIVLLIDDKEGHESYSIITELINGKTHKEVCEGLGIKGQRIRSLFARLEIQTIPQLFAVFFVAARDGEFPPTNPNHKKNDPELAAAPTPHGAF